MVLSPMQCHLGWFIYTTWQKSPNFSWTTSLWVSHWICSVEQCVYTSELESKALRLDSETVLRWCFLSYLPLKRQLFPCYCCFWCPVCVYSYMHSPYTPALGWYHIDLSWLCEMVLLSILRPQHVKFSLNVSCDIGKEGLTHLAISMNTFYTSIWLQWGRTSMYLNRALSCWWLTGSRGGIWWLFGEEAVGRTDGVWCELRSGCAGWVKISPSATGGISRISPLCLSSAAPRSVALSPLCNQPPRLVRKIICCDT